MSHFQHTVFEKTDFFKLIRSINDAQGPIKQDESRLRKIFDKFWDDLEETIAKAIKSEPEPEKKRSTEEMLRELLDVTTVIARNLPNAVQQRTSPPLPRRQLKKDQFWPEIVDRVGKKAPFVRSYLLESSGYAFDPKGKAFEIYFDSDFAEYISLVNNERNTTLIQKILSEMGLGQNCKVEFKEVSSGNAAKEA